MNIVVVGKSGGVGQALEGLLSPEHQVHGVSRSEGGAGAWDAASGDAFPTEGLPDVVDGLVYLPGNIRLKSARALKPEMILEDFELNVLGAYRAVQALLPRLLKSSSASVVMVSTVAASQGMPMHVSTATVKAALEGMSRSLAAEFASRQVRFNVVAPSLVDSPMAAKLLAGPELRKGADARHPLGRVGQPEDVARTIRHLLLEATWTTGQTLGVDGGLSTLRLFQ